jgi:hypothetical protein
MDDDEYIYILPEIKIEDINGEEEGFIKLGDLPVLIDESLIYKGDDFSFEKKVKFTLLDILTCVFEEVIYAVKDGKNIEA